jgi:hypothetical protein
MKTKLATLLIALVFTGCAVTKIQTPDGFTFTTHRLADLTKIGKVQVTMGTNTLTLEGYDSDRQTAAVEAIKLASEVVKRVPVTSP